MITKRKCCDRERVRTRYNYHNIVYNNMRKLRKELF